MADLIPFPIRDVPCLVCGKMLERDPDVRVCERNGDVWSYGIVYDGVICDARGNYGSRAYDPIVDSRRIVFVVCDECFREKTPGMTVLHA